MLEEYCSAFGYFTSQSDEFIRSLIQRGEWFCLLLCAYAQARCQVANAADAINAYLGATASATSKRAQKG